MSWNRVAGERFSIFILQFHLPKFGGASATKDRKYPYRVGKRTADSVLNGRLNANN